MYSAKHHQLLTLLFISFLALSLPLATKLVSQSSDVASRASASDIKINFKIAFKGLKPESTCSASLKTVDLDLVNVTKEVYQPGVGTSMTPVIGETNPDGDQVFSISNLVLDNNFKSVDSFNYIQVKTPAYLSARMCFNNQSSKMTTSSACDLSLTNGVTYDFTKYSLTPGDLNQDGIVNSSDFSMVKYNLDPTADPVCGQETDLNYDGVTNSFDLTYLKKSLLQTNDEVVVDPTDITPTPTASPVKRSLTAQQLGSMKYWLYIPNGYTKDKKWPLVVWLHGGGEFGNNLNALLGSGLPKILQQGTDYEAVVIAPQFVSDYNNNNFVFTKESLITYIVNNYSIDTNKISIAGHSTGANGAFQMACSYPNYFSAVVPISICNHYEGCSIIIAKNKTHVKLFHGTSDKTCGSWRSVIIARDDINPIGGNAVCVQLKGAGHAITDSVFVNYKAVEWMIKQVLGQPWQD